MMCPTCHRPYASRTGAQASPDLERRYICTICGRPSIQKGPGRPRQVCTAPVCNRKAQARRRNA